MTVRDVNLASVTWSIRELSAAYRCLNRNCEALQTVDGYYWNRIRFPFEINVEMIAYDKLESICVFLLELRYFVRFTDGIFYNFVRIVSISGVWGRREV